MVVIAGVDLAWSGRRPSGVCLLELSHVGSRVIDISCSAPNVDAFGMFVSLDALGRDVVVGIDAPLIASPSRRAEAELARTFGRQGVYAYSARPDFLERHRIAEGPKLGTLLAGAAWNLDPSSLTPKPAGRHALEVFPHATTVSLLGAPSALKYKKGSISARLGPLETFQALLRAYAERELPCLLGPDAGAILTRPVGAQSVVNLKAFEDQLDAICCAIAAHHAWKYGTAGLATFGDAANGYISVPKEPTSSLEQSSP